MHQQVYLHTDTRERGMKFAMKEALVLTISYGGVGRAPPEAAWERLQRARANVDAEDSHARTPLHYAAAGGCLKVVHVLLEAGADVRICDEGRMTALHLSCAWARTECSSALRDAGASGGARDARGRTPHDVAGAGRP